MQTAAWHPLSIFLGTVMSEAACTASACTVYQKIMISDDRQVHAIPATQYIIYKVTSRSEILLLLNTLQISSILKIDSHRVVS